MTILFKAKTQEGYVQKILVELLQCNLQTVCFEVDETGIKIQTMDNNKTILVDVFMEYVNFSKYIFKSKEKLYLGITLSHFHKMLKAVKKKDSIELFIDDEDKTNLGIKIIPKENNRVTTSFIKIQQFQNIEISIPPGFTKPIIVPSSEFQKMCKGLTHISKITHVTSKKFTISFSTDAEIMKRATVFGERDDSDDDIKEDEEEEYNEHFDTEQITKITKIAGLNPTIHIYPKSKSFLLFRTRIGLLGTISIYLKPQSQQEIDANTTEITEEE